MPPRSRSSKRQHSYSPDDVVELVDDQPASRPASMRQVIKGINVPADNEDWASLNRWRQSVGLNPVTR